jgi:hypothetical protein
MKQIKPKQIQPTVFKPQLSLEQAEQQFEREYIDSSYYDQLVCDDQLGVLPDGETKFLFLRDILPAADAEMIWEDLRVLPFGQGRRFHNFGLQGTKGGGLVMGWLRKDGRTQLTEATWNHWIVYGIFLPRLLGLASSLLKQYLPECWLGQEARAKRNGEKVIGYGDGDHPLYSTVQLNKNLRFPAHADAKNEKGLACLMAFGRFSGGDLCLPRLRVAFRLRPGDLLFVDTNNELHGNLPIVGERISVVSFLKDFSSK